MSYLQEEGVSKNRLVSWTIVGILHIFLGYALVSGLAVEVVKNITGPMESVNIEEPAPPPDEPPPPPPKLEEIPPYVPPPDVVVQVEAPPPPNITTQTTVVQTAPTVVAPMGPPAPPAPPAPAPPAPAGPDKAATPRGNSVGVSTDDYPEASRRAQEEGRTVLRISIGADGRVKTCETAQSSGHNRLDERACQVALRRWRFNPALKAGEPVDSTKLQPIQWRLEDGR